MLILQESEETVMSIKNKKLYILLTRFRDSGSRMLQAFTGSRYTHASIGLEEDMNTFYSFAYKGFIVEKITRYLKPEKKPYSCKLYEIKVSEKVYNAVKKAISGFMNLKSRLSYSRLGVAMCLFKIPYKKRFSFFCSQFVAEILKRTKAVKLDRDSGMYFPEDLKKLSGVTLAYEGNHRDFVNKYCVQLNYV